MTKKVEITLKMAKLIHNSCKDVPHDIGIELIPMLEEYGKYCAEQAWRGVMFHIPMPITNKSFTDWWNEFKTKEQ